MIAYLFYILFFIVPLVFYKGTSELFEFNKIITLYAITALIVAFWLIKSIRARKFIFRRTILDWPIIAFLAINTLSTLFSIDLRTSLLGYYTRFNGGLVSLFAYSLLYWAFTSNLTKKESQKAIFIFIISTLIASIMAILEHFGIGLTCGIMGFGFNTNCWIQDVQNRVFSTFGQPNWLAATLVILIPIVQGMILTLTENGQKLTLKKLFLYITGFIFFVTLIYTKSRSGLLAFTAGEIIFFSFILFRFRGKHLKSIIFQILVIVFLVFALGTPWTKPIISLGSQVNTVAVGPALETGGTESGQIRKVVWRGAIEIWKHYPILGSGPETFAYSYFTFRPTEQNFTSEWNFIYNKAHNEFLNYLANTGTLGFLSFLTLIGFILLLTFPDIEQKRKEEVQTYILKSSLISAVVTFLITSFFGFSVVPTSLLFFLIPALITTQKNQESLEMKKLNLNQKTLVFLTLVLTATFFVSIFRYWKADTHFNKSLNFLQANNLGKSKEEISKAISLSKSESKYYSEAAKVDTAIALVLNQDKQKVESQKYLQLAALEAEKSITLSPRNIEVRRIASQIYKNLGTIEAIYLTDAERVINTTIKLSPNYPTNYLELAQLKIRQGKIDDAINFLLKAVELKSDYKDARFILAAVYKNNKNFDKAKEEYIYILENIDPQDESVKKALDELN